MTFTATGTSGPATTMVINAGNGQTATVGTTVATAPSVKVTDAGGNPVSGVDVTFAVASGGGSVTGALTATTNASGIAEVGSWKLGTTAGANTLTATSAGLSGSPLTFTATGVAGAASKIAMNAGNGQTVHVGTAVTIPPSVLVTDANNNPVAGVAVTFAVASGGGSHHRRLGHHRRLRHRHRRQLDARHHRRRQHADGHQRRASPARR